MPSPRKRATIVRGAKRASYDAARINAILDANFLCHIGFVYEAEAQVIPTAYVRKGQALYVHGNPRNRMLQALLDGQIACVSVTELNGLVLGRSGLHHSANYRSVVLYTRGEHVADGESEKVALLDALIDHLVPGRAADIRPHTEQELNATLVVRLPILEAAAKIRNGPPADAEKDYALDTWAGVIKLETRAVGIEPCPRLKEEIGVPGYVREKVASR